MAAVLNAELNGVELKINSNNVIGQDVACDCILVGDLCYDEELCTSLLSWLYEMYLEGKTILIGDAGRLKSLNVGGSHRLKLLKSYQLPCHVSDENDGISRAEIWSF